MAEVPTNLANLDPMTAGLILLAGCAAFLVWSGSVGERASHKARQRSGKAGALPPPIVPYDFAGAGRRKRS